MSLETRKKIYLAYGLLLSVLIVAAAVCLMVSCVMIYRSGAHPFTRESIADQFSHIALPVYVCLGGLVGGCILTLALPLESPKVKSITEPKKTIERWMTRVDTAACDPAILGKMKKEQTLRRVLFWVAVAFSVILAMPSLLYLTNLSNFEVATLTDDVIAAMTVVLPSVVVGLAAWVAVTLLHHASYAREAVLAKQAVQTAPAVPKKEKTTEDSTRADKVVWILRGVVLLMAVVFVVLGIANGGMTDVLEKAIKICTECIGLG